MTITQAVRACFDRYADFSGRASRAEFWKFALFVAIGFVVTTWLNSLIFGPSESVQLVVAVDGEGNRSQQFVGSRTYDGGWIGAAFGIAVLLPLLVATWRRLHDTGRPGWLALAFPSVGAMVTLALWATSRPVPIDRTGLDPALGLPAEVLVPALPGLAFLVLWTLAASALVLTILWLCRRSDPGPNRFGPDPREVHP